ncbi:hypothetical protein QJS10_CPA08g00847 [Acorus calamus]|uniref:Uncharacterized protein n=1 Tax=Acorus calamus TaxID=4465 RepID=A0AAV9EAH4_ACOCL|nr:hypothetical protein QJS10_CPA08g00847 [Acorus calamus]
MGSPQTDAGSTRVPEAGTPEARPGQLRPGTHRRPKGRDGRFTPRAGITAAAGTRLALQWILVKGFRLYSFQLPDSKSPDWVICAPAAFLGCGSRFSGSLSGIEP